ncbi:hypothetical protein ACLMJK_003424 [Lecanora helva]
MSAAVSGQTLQPAQIYPHMQGSSVHPDHINGAVDNLASDFGNIHLRNAAVMGQTKASGTPMPINDPNMNPMVSSQNGAPMFVQLNDGTFIYSGPNGTYPQYPNGYAMPVTHPSQYQQVAYHGLSNGPHTPRNNAWIPPQGIQQIPELVAPRRSSWSSNEEPSPHTPLDGYNQAVMISGQSPTTWSTTPSPIQAQYPYNQQVAKAPHGVYVYYDFWKWTQQEPAIPPPVPAIHSGQDGGRGSLDKILDNRNGTTNVYIRGLQPNTDDKMLEGYGRRFGAIASQKAIIEMSTGTCKGYGFIMYHNYDDAENCIRAFYFLGYEAKFAKGLEALFAEAFPENTHAEYKPTSSKILKDSNGISRGVGFARFRTPEICQQIIDAFNNKVIGEGPTATTLQLRFADTEEQKKLKTFTAEKRQFKTNEYNEVVYGPNSPWRRLYSPASNAASYYTPVQVAAPGNPIHWSAQSQTSSISPPYIGYPHSVLGNNRASNGVPPNATTDSNVDIGPIPARHSAHIKIESPSVAAAAKKAAAEKIEDEKPDAESCSTSDEDTLVCKSKSSKSFGADETVISPTKAKL